MYAALDVHKVCALWRFYIERNNIKIISYFTVQEIKEREGPTEKKAIKGSKVSEFIKKKLYRFSRVREMIDCLSRKSNNSEINSSVRRVEIYRA